MSIGTFLKQLTVFSLGLAILLSLLHYSTPLKGHYTISIVSIMFFVVFSIIVYFIGAKAAQSANKNAFTGVIIAFVFGKMFCSIFLVLIYHQWVQPHSNLFLIPFFMVYLFYTIFETYFMIQLGKKTKPEKTNHKKSTLI